MSKTVFRFRLERVRRLRKQAERAAQEELAASLGRRNEGERSLQAIDAEIDGAIAAERRAAGGASPAPARSGNELVAMDAYLERLAGSRAAAVRELALREAEVEERRDALLDAARERQALDRLRERRRSEHERDALRAEGGQLDELGLAAHRRGRAA